MTDAVADVLRVVVVCATIVTGFLLAFRFKWRDLPAKQDQLTSERFHQRLSRLELDSGDVMAELQRIVREHAAGQENLKREIEDSKAERSRMVQANHGLRKS